MSDCTSGRCGYVRGVVAIYEAAEVRPAVALPPEPNTIGVSVGKPIDPACYENMTREEMLADLHAACKASTKPRNTSEENETDHRIATGTQLTCVARFVVSTQMYTVQKLHNSQARNSRYFISKTFALPWS